MSPSFHRHFAMARGRLQWSTVVHSSGVAVACTCFCCRHTWRTQQVLQAGVGAISCSRWICASCLAPHFCGYEWEYWNIYYMLLRTKQPKGRRPRSQAADHRPALGLFPHGRRAQALPITAAARRASVLASGNPRRTPRPDIEGRRPRP